MAKVKAPPATAPRALGPGDTLPLLPGKRVWRVYFSGGANPSAWPAFRYFGPTSSRFDHQLLDNGEPAVQARGIHYAAADALTCLAEVFQKTRIIDRHAGAPRLVGYDLDARVELLDLTGAFITQVGASPAINSTAKSRSRAWSRYFYRHYRSIGGVFYASSMYALADAYAFYERAIGMLPAAPVFDRALADPALTARLMAASQRLGYGIV